MTKRSPALPLYAPTQLHLPEGSAKMGGWGATRTQEGRLCHLHALPGPCAAEDDLGPRAITLLCEARDLAESKMSGETKDALGVDEYYEDNAERCE